MTFLQARHYTPSNRTSIDNIVFHTMEAPEMGETAEGTANYFHNTDVEASAHACFDSNSVVDCVRDQDIAWHAPGLNDRSLGYEHAGYARQTPEEWSDPYTEAMLRISAQRVAAKCKQYRLPIAYVDAAGLLRRDKGITTHNDVTIAYRQGDHWDPGPNWPVNHYLDLVRHYAGESTTLPAPPPLPQIIRQGATGNQVLFLQKMLNILRPYRRNAAGSPNVLPVREDGVFGGQTSAAVSEFKRWLNGILAASGKAAWPTDGAVGPKTAAAMAFWVPYAYIENAKIHPGDKGKGIKFMQAMLNILKVYRGREAKTLKLTDVYDMDTQNAIVEFKRFVNGILALGGKKPMVVDGSYTDAIKGQIAFWVPVALESKGK